MTETVGNLVITPQISENEVQNLEKSSTKREPNVSESIKNRPFEKKIYWHVVIISVITHIFGIAGIFMFDSLKLFMYVFIIGYIGLFGITAGAHRLWSHRSYKARLPLRIFLMLLNSSMFQGNIYLWSKNHRVHHKYSETDADPYNSKRGFFFTHIGWVYLSKHPDFREKSKTIDCSDLKADPVVKFQVRYYTLLVIITAVIAPSLIPYYLWDVSMFRCFCTCVCLRHIFFAHVIGLINSVAHTWGHRPYNQEISPAENLIVSILASGEGFHNYHHTFPWDYSTSEYGWKVNISTMFIDFMAWIGLAYDRKKVSPELVAKFKDKYNYKN